MFWQELNSFNCIGLYTTRER